MSAVNLSPIAQLMLVGLLLAAGPLVWVWLRSRNAPAASRMHRLTLLTLFLTFDLVLFGAFTRLTDSGLGCPDWPGCYGHASPVGAVQHIAQAQAEMPTGPVTLGKAWIEMVHRYLATGVGVLILAIALASWMLRQRLQQSMLWPLLTLVWVCVQGAFGALTVTWKLFPAIVTLHLLGGMVLLALLQAQASRLRLSFDEDGPVPLLDHTRTWLGFGFALLWWQIALGGWVSTNYAVLVCNGFPTCQGAWWPTMDFASGFAIWRELGLRTDGVNISMQALTAIHMVHRIAAVVVFVVLGGLALRLYRVAALRGPALALMGLLGLQLATGLSNVVLGWPLVAAVLHTGGAAAMVLVLTALLMNTRSALDTVSASKFSSSRLWA